MTRLKFSAKNTLFTLLLTTLAACQGNCSPIEASHAATGAKCYFDDNSFAVCIKGMPGEGSAILYGCAVLGTMYFDATCSRIGTVTYTAPEHP